MNAYFRSTLLIAFCLVISQSAFAQSGLSQTRIASADPYFTPAMQPVPKEIEREPVHRIETERLPTIPDLTSMNHASPDEQVFVSHNIVPVKPLPSIENSIIRKPNAGLQTVRLPSLKTSITTPTTNHPLGSTSTDSNSWATARTSHRSEFQPNPFFDSGSESSTSRPPHLSQRRQTSNAFVPTAQNVSTFVGKQEADSKNTRTVTKKTPIDQDDEKETSNTQPEFASTTATATPVTSTDRQANSVKAQEFESGRVLALVGGEPVFAGDLIFEANKMIEQVMPTAPESVKAQQRPMLMKRLLPRFVEAKILYMATIRSLPAEADIEQILEQASGEFDSKALPMMMEKSGIDNQVQYDAHLRAMGSSLRQLRRTWSKEQLMRFFLAKQLQVDEEVTHQDMLNYYNEHATDYAIPARVRWEQVVAKFSKRSSRADAKQAIVEMGNQIVYGAKFGSVAKKMSDGYRSFEGGMYDWTTKNALKLKVIDRALFSLPIGELSDIIESSDGYHIVRVIEREEATKTSFLEAQIEIKKKLSNDRREKAFQDHIAKVKEQIPVEIFEDALSANLDK